MATKKSKRRPGMVPVQAYVPLEIKQILQDNGQNISAIIQKALEQAAKEIEGGQ